ncbi:hypothetical protein PM082_004603 [Marasmius tenuissimus]|nr:hypothetical protein PM082_004603 [Marasmius tenuissimus]
MKRAKCLVGYDAGEGQLERRPQDPDAAEKFFNYTTTPRVSLVCWSWSLRASSVAQPSLFTMLCIYLLGGWME